jgi:hypothetical protein
VKVHACAGKRRRHHKLNGVQHRNHRFITRAHLKIMGIAIENTTEQIIELQRMKTVTRTADYGTGSTFGDKQTSKTNKCSRLDDVSHHVLQVKHSSSVNKPAASFKIAMSEIQELLPIRESDCLVLLQNSFSRLQPQIQQRKTLVHVVHMPHEPRNGVIAAMGQAQGLITLSAGLFQNIGCRPLICCSQKHQTLKRCTCDQSSASATTS